MNPETAMKLSKGFGMLFIVLAVIIFFTVFMLFYDKATTGFCLIVGHKLGDLISGKMVDDGSLYLTKGAYNSIIDGGSQSAMVYFRVDKGQWSSAIVGNLVTPPVRKTNTDTNGSNVSTISYVMNLDTFSLPPMDNSSGTLYVKIDSMRGNVVVSEMSIGTIKQGGAQ